MAAQTMVVDPYDHNPDIGSWVADFCAEFSVSAFYLHIVLNKVKEKSSTKNLITAWIY
jgi:hypothetical protein